MNPIDEFESLAEEIFSVYLDATEGFRRIAITAEILVYDKAKKGARDDKGVSPAGHLIYALGKKEDGSYIELSARTGKEIVEANLQGGSNHRFVASMALVALYQYWDDHYRAAIASHLGKAKSDLKVPIFGDLRKFRRAIIHNKGRIIPEMNSLELFKWEEPVIENDPFDLDHENMCAIWWAVKIALNDLRE